MQDKKRIWVWVGVVVVVIGVVLFLIWKPSGSNLATNAPAPVFAPKGQLTPEFPKQLILHFLNGVNTSYSVVANASSNQYTAELNTSSSVSFIYNQYLSYFLSNGWKIVNVKQGTESGGIYASTSTADASIAIIGKGEESQVIISYLTK